MFAYHFTAKENISSIMEKGLIGGFKRGIPCYLRNLYEGRFYDKIPVYLALPDCELDYFYHEDNIKEILTVNIDGLKIYPDPFSMLEATPEGMEYVESFTRSKLLDAADTIIHVTRTICILDPIEPWRISC